MIAADTSSLIAYLAGESGPDIDLIEAAMSADTLRIPPVVVTELATRSSPAVEELLASIAILPIIEGYWLRAGESRGLIRAKGLKATLSDALVAQCCIDAYVSLITRDGDFRHFVRWCGLKLAD